LWTGCFIFFAIATHQTAIAIHLKPNSDRCNQWEITQPNKQGIIRVLEQVEYVFQHRKQLLLIEFHRERKILYLRQTLHIPIRLYIFCLLTEILVQAVSLLVLSLGLCSNV
jgi:hypothetical protein